jgi:hypothetical protein
MLFAAPAHVFQSLRWTQPGAELETISTQPAACVDFEATDRAKVQAGLALFNTPTLLGGQAAKAGLSCASCHVNGRDNPHFLLPSLSGAAGTADVTSSFFSAARGNGVHDPVQIPDLALPGKISRAQGDPALEGFIRNLIVEEFSGMEPSPATLSALASYVRAMRPCQDNAGAQERRLSDQLDLIEVAIEAASAMERLGETSTAKLAIASARHQLGLINERYSANRFRTERKLLLDESSRLRTIAETQDRTTVGASLASWNQRFERKIVPRLIAGEPRSLYNRNEIVAAFDGGIAKSK